MNLFIKQNRLTVLEKELMDACREGWGEGIVREFGMDMCTLLYLKWITNKFYCITQGTVLNVRWEGSLGKNGYIYMCG